MALNYSQDYRIELFAYQTNDPKAHEFKCLHSLFEILLLKEKISLVFDLNVAIVVM